MFLLGSQLPPPVSRRSTYSIEWSYGDPCFSTPNVTTWWLWKTTLGLEVVGYKSTSIPVTLKKTGWWQLKYFSFSPLPGEDSHFDEHIFQMGWNHQPEKVRMRQPKRCFGIYWRFEQIEIAITMEWMNSFSFNQTRSRTKDVSCTFFVFGSGQLGGGDDTTMYLARQYIPFYIPGIYCQFDPIGWLYAYCMLPTKLVPALETCIDEVAVKQKTTCANPSEKYPECAIFVNPI